MQQSRVQVSVQTQVSQPFFLNHKTRVFKTGKSVDAINETQIPPLLLHTSSSELNYALAGVLTVSDLLSYERRDSINRQHRAYMFEYHRLHIIHQLIVSIIDTVYSHFIPPPSIGLSKFYFVHCIVQIVEILYTFTK